MSEANLHIKITKDDSAIKELLAQLAKISSTFGGATSEKVKKEFAGMAEAAKKAANDSSKAKQEALQKDISAEEQATERAAQIKIRSDKEYADLKHKYVLKGLDATRQAIHEEEQIVKSSRNAIAKATREGVDKETIAVLKGERDKQNARLQGLRSVEKEITGARTFTEQLEKNVY